MTFAILSDESRAALNSRGHGLTETIVCQAKGVENVEDDAAFISDKASQVVSGICQAVLDDKIAKDVEFKEYDIEWCIWLIGEEIGLEHIEPLVQTDANHLV